MWTSANAVVSILSNRTGKVTVLDVHTHPFITSVDIEVIAEAPTSITIGIQAPFEEGLNLMSGDLFVHGNLISVKIKWSDGEFTPTYTGLLNEGGVGLMLTPDGVSGSISAVTVSGGMFTTGFSVLSGSLSSVVSELADYFKFPVVFGDGVVDILDKDGKTEWSTNGKSYIEFLKIELKSRGLFFNITHEGGTGNSEYSGKFYIVSKAASSSTDTSRTFVMRGKIDPFGDSMVHPMISFSPEVAVNSWMPGPVNATRGIEASVLDDATGKVESISANASDIAIQNDGESLPVGDNKDSFESNVNYGSNVKVGSNESAEYMSSATSRDGLIQAITNLVSGMQVTIETFGIPDIKPYELINIAGCGPMFNGKYQILSWTHSFSIDGFRTSVICLSMGYNYSNGSAKSGAGTNNGG